MDSIQYDVRRTFGILFVTVAIFVIIASTISEILFLSNLPNYLHVISWLVTFGIIFGIFFLYFKEKISLIRNRMKNSLSWPLSIKIINGLCWALPFILIIVFPQYFQYLILLGIGLGNSSTYAFLKIFSKQNNKEQLLVGLIALMTIPIVFQINISLFESHQDIAILLSRISISISYAVGGVYAIFAKT